MENNNNGRGIFYGVIGVATLVVAIIGATFAYFSASITSANNAVGAGTATLTLEIDNELRNFRTDMIPVKTTDGAMARYPGLNGDSWTASNVEKTCRDNVGNSICSVYQFTIVNPNPTTAQTVQGSLKVTANSTVGDADGNNKTFQNLYYAVFKGAAANISSYDLVTTTGVATEGASTGAVIVPKTKVGAVDAIDTWTNTQEELENSTSGSNTTTYTVVVWLEEAGAANNAEQGGLFSAAITFDTNTGAGGVTGQISTTTPSA